MASLPESKVTWMGSRFDLTISTGSTGSHSNSAGKGSWWRRLVSEWRMVSRSPSSRDRFKGRSNKHGPKRERLPLAERLHAIGQRGQGRDVVGEDRGHDAEPQREGAGDAEPVGGQDQVPAPPHVAVEVAGDVAEVAELGQPLLHEDDVRRVGGDRRG